ncbi:hypothetical protein GOL37_08755 [Sinorhizobium medicae]|nr:hypothetical protein [Sinorhizobium medicae]MDX1019128.1 hypothetical protein [Sinorhizobium medicae]
MFVVLGMGSLGALLGTWIALSKSAVVLTVLPLLFGILGSAGGYSIWKLDGSCPVDRRRLQLIGSSLTAISMTCLIAMGSTILLRPTLASLLRTTPVEVTHLNNPLSGLLLREKLSRIGATHQEIEEVLSRYLVSNTDDKPRLTILRDAAIKFAGAYEKAVQSIKPQPQAATVPVDTTVSEDFTAPAIEQESIPYRLRQVYELSQAITAVVDVIGLDEPGYDKALAGRLLREAIGSTGASLSGFSDREISKHAALLRAWLVLESAIKAEEESFIGNREMMALDDLAKYSNDRKTDFVDVEIGGAIGGWFTN